MQARVKRTFHIISIVFSPRKIIISLYISSTENQGKFNNDIQNPKINFTPSLSILYICMLLLLQRETYILKKGKKLNGFRPWHHPCSILCIWRVKCWRQQQQQQQCHCQVPRPTPRCGRSASAHSSPGGSRTRRRPMPASP